MRPQRPERPGKRRFRQIVIESLKSREPTATPNIGCNRFCVDNVLLLNKRPSGHVRGLSGMKKFAAGVMLGFVASWAMAFASSNLNHDGSFWNRLNNAAKDGYVNGYSDAMRVTVPNPALPNPTPHLTH